MLYNDRCDGGISAVVYEEVDYKTITKRLKND